MSTPTRHGETSSLQDTLQNITQRLTDLGAQNGEGANTVLSETLKTMADDLNALRLSRDM